MRQSHKCCVCSKEAHWGYGVFILGAGYWACAEHRQEAIARAVLAEPELSRFISEKHGSGQLNTTGQDSPYTTST